MDKYETIARLNDFLRRTMTGGKVVMTLGISELPAITQQQVFEAVRDYSDFNEDNNPHGERDFGAFELSGERYFWKIDYYDSDLDYLSPDPADPTVTVRVLTIMKADEY